MTVCFPDWNDPCDVYKKLREAHYMLLTGQHAQTVRYTSGGGQTEEATFQKSDLTALTVAMSKAKAECEALSSGKTKRFGLATGGKRRL